MNPEMIEKLKTVSKEVREIFPISLFAAIKRSDSESWDLVFGGKNLNNQENLNSIVKIVSKHLVAGEILTLSQVVLLNSSEPFVKNLTNTFAFSMSDSFMDLQSVQINGVFIRQAYLFVSKKES